MTGLALKTMSILCLMILPGGFANPVAGEGGFGLDFVAGLTDFFIGDAVIEKIVVDGVLGHGRSFNVNSVRHVGYAMDVENSTSCCQECWKTYPETQLVSFEHKSRANDDAIKNCKCLKSKPGKNPTTHQIGKLSGQCGTWDYHGEGDLGDDRYFDSSTVDWKGSMTKVNDSTACCQECNKKHPGTALFTFVKENQLCLCYNTQMGKNPLLLEMDYSASVCVPAITQDTSENDASSATVATEVTAAPAALTDAPAPVTDAPAPVTDANAAVTDANAAVTDANAAVTDANAAVTDANAAVTDAPQIDDQIMNDGPNVTSKGEVSEPAVSVDDKSESDASADSGNVPDAAALTITTTTVKPEICDGSFVCCPHLTDGDNTAGSEKFISESEYEDTFSSCQDACKILHPFSNGVTQSKTKTYTNGKPQCWCEFGQSVFHQSTGYQTCLFPVGEDDYDYE